METHPVTKEFLAVVQELSPDHQLQLLQMARALAYPGPSQTPSDVGSRPGGALTERDGFLLVSAKLEGPLVDHREIRDEYMAKVMGPAE